MINPKKFIEFLSTEKIHFYCGVPDSLLKEFCFCVSDSLTNQNHMITANEGSAIALACGYYLTTKKIPLVYFQNSGMGNTINPLLSLCDPSVYKIPMILLIGWRGEPGINDEPQHVKQGEIQENILKTLDIPYQIVDRNFKNYNLLSEIILKSSKESRPTAILVRKNTFSKYHNKIKVTSNELMREKVLEEILKSKIKDEIFVTTTGKTSREFYEIRKKFNIKHKKDFLTVGSMGHCSQIALGIALFNENDVYCIDGDGSVIMHMGSLAINGTSNCNNFKHIILNNGSHESVGGQPTVGKKISFIKIAKNCGYRNVKSIKSYNELKQALIWLSKEKGPVLLEIIIKNGSRDDLGRPNESPYENKLEFMKNIL